MFKKALVGALADERPAMALVASGAMRRAGGTSSGGPSGGVTGSTSSRAKDGMPRGEVAALCARLGITTDVLGPSRSYLLVTASSRPGARHVVTLFSTEDDARAAFVQFRRAEPGEGPWAELDELSATGAVRRLCWFGLEWSTGETRRPRSSPQATARRDRNRSPDHASLDRRPRNGLRTALWRHIRRMNASPLLVAATSVALMGAGRARR